MIKVRLYSYIKTIKNAQANMVQHRYVSFEFSPDPKASSDTESEMLT